MRFSTYWKEEKTCDVDITNGCVTFTNYVKVPFMLPFGVRKHATYADVLEFFEWRCFPRERANCKTVLKSLGLDYYDPEKICRKTHGLQFDDFLWIQFEGECISYKDIKLRD